MKALIDDDDDDDCCKILEKDITCEGANTHTHTHIVSITRLSF